MRLLAVIYSIFWFILFLVFLSPTCKKSPEYYFTEGERLSAEGAHIEAIRYYTRAIRDKPDYLEAYVSRANAWMKEDSMDRAIEDYHKVIEIRPSGEGYYLLGYAYWRSASGRDSLACKYWEIGKEQPYNYGKCWDAVREKCKNKINQKREIK